MTRVAQLPNIPTLSYKQASYSTVSVDGEGDGRSHYNDWPNVAGFNIFTKNMSQSDSPPKERYQEPNDTNPKSFEFSHWFDGFTHVHKFDLRRAASGEMEVLYASRGQVDTLLEKARASGFKLEGFTFGQKRDPCDSFFRKLKTALVIPRQGQADVRTDNIGVALVPAYHLPADQRDQTLAITTDNSKTKEIDLETLEPIKVSEQVFRHSSLKGNLSAAHPCQDPETGDLFNYNLEFGANATYRIFRTSPEGETTILATVAGRGIQAAYMHSLFITQNFVVLCIWPAYYKANGMSILWERNIIDAIRPSGPDDQCTWLVVDRIHDRGLVKQFKSSSMFSFHTTNAFETERNEAGEVDIVAELCQYESTEIIHRFYYDNILSNGKGARDWVGPHASRKQPVSLVRYRLPSVPIIPSVDLVTEKQVLSQTTAAEEMMRLQEPLAGELPCINTRYLTREHRYVYALINREKSTFIDGLVKTDTQTGQAVIWECDKHTPGEPVFVPRPGALAEDDGVLLVVVLDGVKGSSYLLILDAQSMKEVARAEAEVPVGAGFHGIHLPYSDKSTEPPQN